MNIEDPDYWSNRKKEIEGLLEESRAKRSKEPLLKRVLDELYNMLFYTRKTIFYIKELKKWFEIEPETLGLADDFILYSSYLYSKNLDLQCAQLLEKNKDSINVNFLLNIVENEFRLFFPKENKKNILKIVKSDKQKYELLYKKISKIKLRRDKEIAHIDKSKIKNDLNFFANIKLSEYDSLIKELEAIMIRYYKFGRFTIPNSFEKRQSLSSNVFEIGLDKFRIVLSIGLDNVPEEIIGEKFKLSKIMNHEKLKRKRI
ncbi:MAG: hypothetical protein H6557_23840 [Lewinellaceae bacterium]|nr:hypothetical protein [Lewinellaceae bacterium]